MAVQIERIAMVLSAMRIESKVESRKSKDCSFVCTDEDYETAEMIGSKMLMHMAMAYRMIKGDETETMPEQHETNETNEINEILRQS